MDDTRISQKSIIYLAPIIVLILMLPVIIYARRIELTGYFYDIWSGARVLYDVHAYYRSIFIILVAAAIILLYFIYRIDKSYRPNKIAMLAFPMIYILLILLTIYFSDQRHISIWGMLERYEGGLVLIAYMVFLIYTAKVVRYRNQYKILVIALLIASFIVGTVGIFQFFGYNYFNTDFIQSLIMPAELADRGARLNAALKEGTINSTLYNSNFVGSFMALMFPLSFGLFMITKKRWTTTIMAIHSCLMFANWIGCRSRAGMVGVFVATMLMSVVMRRKFWKNHRRLLIVIPYITILLVMNNFTDGSLFTKMSTLSLKVEEDFSESRYIHIEDIKFSGNEVTLITEKQTLVTRWDDGILSFMNENGKILDITDIGREFTFRDSEYRDLTFTNTNAESFRLLHLNLRGIRMDYYMTIDKIYLLSTHGRLYDEIPRAPHMGFEGRERFGSGRGYIWSRALPLLKDTLILGNGPDTFSIYFPQEDFIGKLNSTGRVNILVDKPHNYYIQLAHDTGVISLLTLLGFFFVYAIQSIKLYLPNQRDDFEVHLGRIIACSAAAYLIAALFNDSVVYVAPFFWIMLGMGISLNHKIHKSI